MLHTAQTPRFRAPAAPVSPCKRLTFQAFAWLLLWLASTAAQASDRRVSVRSTGSAAAMLSSDQVGRMRYDQVGILGTAHVHYAARTWLEPSLGLAGGGFLASQGGHGGLLAPVAGVLVVRRSDRLSPFATLDAGPAFTGTLARPFFSLGVGLDVPLSTRVSLGPVLGYGHVIQWNQAGSSTDARYLWVGLSMRAHRSPREAPVPRAPRVPAAAPAPVMPVAHEPEDPAELVALIERALPSPSARVELLAPVLFRFDSAELEPIGVAMLHEVAHVLDVRRDIALLQIQGYADARGDAAYNAALSRRRATRVLEWLVEHGVSASRLTIASEGEAAPVETGASESAHEQNRRVIFRVLALEEP
jgi:peptidoglycan-associated lipoprotein